MYLKEHNHRDTTTTQKGTRTSHKPPSTPTGREQTNNSHKDAKKRKKDKVSYADTERKRDSPSPEHTTPDRKKKQNTPRDYSIPQKTGLGNTGTTEGQQPDPSHQTTKETTTHPKVLGNNTPPPTHANGTTTRNTRTPYQGPYRITTWNAQGFLAHDPIAQQMRRTHMMKLCRNTDILCMQETHSTRTAADAWEPPEGFTAFWSHESNQKAGIVTLIKTDFRKTFNPVMEKDIDHVIEGRVMGINLHHPTMGNLYVANLYLQSGSDPDKDRQHAIRQLAKQIPHHHKQTTILTGDFNFVESKEDRLCYTSGEHTGQKDNHEAQLFKSTMLTPHHLSNVHQPHYTHRTPHSSSTLDRFYLNHHPLDQLDFAFHCTALEWTTHSDHRPVRLTKTSRATNEHATIPNHHLNKPEWHNRLNWTFSGKIDNHTKQQAHHNDHKKPIHPMIMLKLYKDSMWDLSKKMNEEEKVKDTTTFSCPKNEDELLNHMSSAIRNITRFSAHHPPHWTSIKYEHGLTEEWNQGINTKDCTSRLRKLKDTALTLYRQLALKAEEKKRGWLHDPGRR